MSYLPHLIGTVLNWVLVLYLIANWKLSMPVLWASLGCKELLSRLGYKSAVIVKDLTKEAPGSMQGPEARVHVTVRVSATRLNFSAAEKHHRLSQTHYLKISSTTLYDGRNSHVKLPCEACVSRLSIGDCGYWGFCRTGR